MSNEIIINEIRDICKTKHMFKYEWCRDKTVELCAKLSNKDLLIFFEKIINWDVLSLAGTLSLDFISFYEHKVNWKYISKSQKLNEAFILKYKNDVNWNYISIYQILSPEFMEHPDVFPNLQWECIVRYQVLPFWFIDKYFDKFEIDCAIYQILNIDLLRKYQDRLDWDSISQFQILSEEAIQEFAHLLDFNILSATQLLSTNIIEKYYYYINFERVVRRQVLQPDLLDKFSIEIGLDYDPMYVAKFQKLPNDMIKKYNVQIEKINNSELNWLYLNNDQKINCIVKRIPQVEIFNDDYVIGYMITNHCGGSIFKRQQFDINKTYQAPCDFTNKIDSFGFVVYSSMKEAFDAFYIDANIAKNYHHIAIYAVKINISDIGHCFDNGHIRCSKLTVLKQMMNI